MSDRSSWGADAGQEIVEGLRVVRRLGGGARFETYAAIDERRLATVVVKIVRPARVGERAVADDLEREADALRTLAHPFVVRCFEVVHDGPRPHLVLEHVEGPTLRGLIKSFGPLALEQAIPLGVHLAGALHYLAAEGWVHLDIKPANVVIGVTPRLIDFGVARPVARARALRTPTGTSQYMAPEQCIPDGANAMGPASDVWALGATLYRALTGRRPFRDGERDADDPMRRWPQLVEDPRPLDRRVPGPVATAIAACLEKGPARRPSAAELAEALEPALSSLPRRPVLRGRRSQVR